MALRWIAQLLILVLIAAVTAAGWLWLGEQRTAGAGDERRGGDRAQPVDLAAVEAQALRESVQAVGTVVARESVDIVAEVSGRLLEASVREGERVAEGEVLFRLDDVRERADLRQARAERDDAAAKYRRAAALFEQRDVSEAEVDERRAALEVAEARVETAQSRLRDRTIRAPFDGVVGLREVSPGAFIEPGMQLTTLDDLDVVRLEFAVPERFITGLTPGRTVEARSTSPDSPVFEGQVTRVATRVDPVTRSLRVQADFDNEDGRLRQGMFMLARLLLDEREALTVPEEALLKEGTSSAVFVLDDDGERVSRVEVTSGQRRDGRVEIRGDGLEAGARVVVAGLQSVRDGARVAPREQGDDEAGDVS